MARQTVSGVEWRDGYIAIVTAEVSGHTIRPIEAGVVPEMRAHEIELGETIVAVTPAEYLYHATKEIPSAVTLPDVHNYGQIISLGELRPGGELQAVCARQREDKADVGIVNLTRLNEHAENLSERLERPIDACIERVMAWFRLATRRKVTLPHVLFDLWASPANVIMFGDGTSPLASQIESVPGPNVAEQIKGAAKAIRPHIGPLGLRTVALLGGSVTDHTVATATLSPLNLTVEPLWGRAEPHPWDAALGAICEAFAPTHRYEPVTINQ